MSDLCTWCPIPLGRISQTRYGIHWILSLFFTLALLYAAVRESVGVVETLSWLVMLLVALVWHELGHGLIASWLNRPTSAVRLWPLGSFTAPHEQDGRPETATQEILVALAGPLASLVGTLLSAAVVAALDGQFAWWPIREDTPYFGAPMVDGEVAATTSLIWWVGWFGHLSWLLFLANILIPAMPLDLGRILRSVLIHPRVTVPRSNIIASWAAHASVALVMLLGLIRLIFGQPAPAIALLALGVLLEWMVRIEGRPLNQNEFGDAYFDEEDSSVATVGTEEQDSDPEEATEAPQESRLYRWRRQRSEARRQRRAAREAAEARRLDEILTKLHDLGRTALSSDELRFLQRHSRRLRRRRDDPQIS